MAVVAAAGSAAAAVGSWVLLAAAAAGILLATDAAAAAAAARSRPAAAACSRPAVGTRAAAGIRGLFHRRVRAAGRPVFPAVGEATGVVAGRTWLWLMLLL